MRERTGISVPSYNPDRLEYEINHTERGGASLCDVTGAHRGALDFNTRMNADAHALCARERYNRALCGSVPQPHDQPSQYASIELTRLHVYEFLKC